MKLPSRIVDSGNCIAGIGWRQPVLAALRRWSKEDWSWFLGLCCLTFLLLAAGEAISWRRFFIPGNLLLSFVYPTGLILCLARAVIWPGAVLLSLGFARDFADSLGEVGIERRMSSRVLGVIVVAGMVAAIYLVRFRFFRPWEVPEQLRRAGIHLEMGHDISPKWIWRHRLHTLCPMLIVVSAVPVVLWLRMELNLIRRAGKQ